MLVMLYGIVYLVLTRCYLVQYYQYESYAPYGTNGTHQISRVTTKVRAHVPKSHRSSNLQSLPFSVVAQTQCSLQILAGSCCNCTHITIVFSETYC